MRLEIKILIAFIYLSFCSCSGIFEKYNTDQTAYSEDAQKIDYYWYGISLMNVQRGIYFNYDWGKGTNWPFQLMQNLNVDLFAGYFHNYKFEDAATNSMYDLNDNWNSCMWEFTYGYVMPEIKKAETRSFDALPEFYAVAKILKVELMHRVSDIYGPIVYSTFGNSKTGTMPDSQQEAYACFFEDLDEALSILKDYSGDEKLAKFDFLMPAHKKNYRQWMKFANSLRLRLAVRLSNADPQKARAEAGKSFLPENGGFLSESDDIVAVSTEETGYTNPLGEINKSWGEVYLNANMESILTGYDDPRLAMYYGPATGVGYEGEYRGIRQGTGFNHRKYVYHSKSTISKDTKAVLMTPAEVWFLRAEAALRGWTGEDVKTCYENGVKSSFHQWNCTNVESYLLGENVPADYVDVFDPEYNIKAQSRISPRWDETLTKEEKLEKIITQKWIACYPEGCEAWAEQRRTGYPRLFPVLKNQSRGTIDAKVMIRRLNFPFRIKTINPEQYIRLCELLQGADTGGTRLWWDTGKNDF
jgi:hypothetical protein